MNLFKEKSKEIKDKYDIDNIFEMNFDDFFEKIEKENLCKSIESISYKESLFEDSGEKFCSFALIYSIDIYNEEYKMNFLIINKFSKNRKLEKSSKILCNYYQLKPSKKFSLSKMDSINHRILNPSNILYDKIDFSIVKKEYYLYNKKMSELDFFSHNLNKVALVKERLELNLK